MTLWNGSFPFYPGANVFPFDTTWAIIISVFLSMLGTFIIILPGIRGKGRLFWFLRVVMGLFVGAVVLSWQLYALTTSRAVTKSPLPTATGLRQTAIQFTRDWETGWVTANTSYKSFSHALVNVDIGLHIGLAGMNVTLVGNPVNQVNETINYNEHFVWSFNADYDHSYGEGLEKGLPSPILYVAEKFTTQSPCGMHRQYCISGHYASLTLWKNNWPCVNLPAIEEYFKAGMLMMAFCTWLISILLFSMPILLYGGCMLLLTAALMLFSLLFFFTARNTPKCPIQFGLASLKTDYGGSFWLTLVTGLLCLLLGLGIIILNSVQPEKLKLIFNLDKGKGEEEKVWDKSYLPAEPSSSAQDVLMVPLGDLCEVTATQL